MQAAVRYGLRSSVLNKETIYLLYLLDVQPIPVSTLNQIR